MLVKRAPGLLTIYTETFLISFKLRNIEGILSVSLDYYIKRIVLDFELFNIYCIFHSLERDPLSTPSSV